MDDIKKPPMMCSSCIDWEMGIPIGKCLKCFASTSDVDVFVKRPDWCPLNNSNLNVINPEIKNNYINYSKN